MTTGPEVSPATNGAQGHPLLSVVIAAHDAAAAMGACLAALERQAGAIRFEVIVADSSTDDTPDIVRRRFPRVRLLHFDRPLTVPELRGRGIAAASGEIIAILDPYSVADERWAAEVIAAHAERPHLVIGGAVDLHHDCRGFLDWALYINEYGMFMPPVPRGETWILPGSNIAYKRRALFDGGEPRFPVFWKTFTNWELEGASHGLWLEPRILVHLRKPIPFTDYLRTRRLHGRCFAGMRVEARPSLERWGRAATCPAVPFVLLYRWGRSYVSKGRQLSKFVLTLPLQIVLFGYWAVGEFQGYLRGPGGSCRQLFY
jgi:glycosyltransferase involved in cell wall biosynthesis